MGRVDFANQFQELYKVHRATFRTWWPLFYWLINAVCVNAYRLYVLYSKEHDLETLLLSHLRFCTELYCKLLQYSTAVQQIQLQISLPGQRTFGSDLPHLHFWVQRPIQSSCEWCLYKLRCNRLQGTVKAGARAKGSILGCSFCDVALCQVGSCWDDFHSNN
jgi:hypothetical protein